VAEHTAPRDDAAGTFLPTQTMLLTLVMDGDNGMTLFSANIESIHQKRTVRQRVIAPDMCAAAWRGAARRGAEGARGARAHHCRRRFPPGSAEKTAIANASSVFPWPEHAALCTGGDGTLTVWKALL
jgi:hypothetical protein